MTTPSPEALQALIDYQLKVRNACKSIAQIQQIDVAPTTCNLIYQQDKLRLYHYPGNPALSDSTPLLICYALVNRPYILDLDQRRSFISLLQQQVSNLYLIDWGYPDLSDCMLDLDDYINDYLDNCVEAALEHSQQQQLNLLGICQGGTLSLCYSALHQHKISKLITMVTPVDFKTSDNLLSHLTQQIDINLLRDTYGNIPGQILNGLFSSLMPARLGPHKMVQAPLMMQTADTALGYLRMERWINDSPDQAGTAFAEFITTFFQQNRFIEGDLTIGEQSVGLKQISCPVLNIYASQDHLVPPSASKPLKDLTNSVAYQEIEVQSGHIGIFVSPRVNKPLSQQIGDWLQHSS